MGILLIILYPFQNELLNIWLVLMALPYFIVYSRDLAQNGYQARDVFKVYAALFAQLSYTVQHEYAHIHFPADRGTHVMQPRFLSAGKGLAPVSVSFM